MTHGQLNRIANEYGDSFYILDSKLFEQNYYDMLTAFRAYYPDTHIAYSYKTNYTPKLCKIIQSNGGYAEVVSEMELWLTLQMKVNPQNIYYNGPYKKKDYIEKFILMEGNINLDSIYEVDIISEIARKNVNKKFEVGIRCNMDIGQKEPSRFGFDVQSGAFFEAIHTLNGLSNVHVTGLHCHLPFRSLDSFKDRFQVLSCILNQMSDYDWNYISFGGGYMGEVDEKLAKEFSFKPPVFKEYAEVIAGGMKNFYRDNSRRPKLIIEPGSALVANTMKYVTRVIDIKKIKEKHIAVLSGSIYNINPSAKGIKRPITVYSDSDAMYYEAVDMAGYTCIESDYLYRNFQGNLAKGDFVVFHNVGSYSLVMKPPFILPDVPMIELEKDSILLIKQKQSEESIFADFFI